MKAKLCNVCGVRRPKTGSKGTETSPHNDMCNYCFEEGGWENTHSDYRHDAISAEVEDKGGDPAEYLSEHDLEELGTMSTCWICNPKLNLAKLPAKASTGKAKAPYARRPQLNHKGHSHPQTPAARRACKALFWAMVAKGLPKDKDMVMAMVEWDANLDGFGKPVEAKKPTPMTVVPRGPKGGVVNQLKASKPSNAK